MEIEIREGVYVRVDERIMHNAICHYLGIDPEKASFKPMSYRERRNADVRRLIQKRRLYQICHTCGKKSLYKGGRCKECYERMLKSKSNIRRKKKYTKKSHARWTPGEEVYLKKVLSEQGTNPRICRKVGRTLGRSALSVRSRYAKLTRSL